MPLIRICLVLLWVICFLWTANLVNFAVISSAIKITDSIPLCIGHFLFLVGWSLLSRNSHQEVFLVKGILKIRSKFTGEHPCRSVISIKLLATLLKLHFGMGVLLQFAAYFQKTFYSEHLWTVASVFNCRHHTFDLVCKYILGFFPGFSFLLVHL